ncbi:MAG: hypothetical protein LH647_21155 [Leptolyngbyaceae cyanobacterium CAN_BIN12]|nr:hypothetical protein [Leptolyngbyaceae cyanobacterium CAN_BIN12]
MKTLKHFVTEYVSILKGREGQSVEFGVRGAIALLLRKSTESVTTSSTDVNRDRVRNGDLRLCINQRGIGWSNGLCVELLAISERKLPVEFC